MSVIPVQCLLSLTQASPTATVEHSRNVDPSLSVWPLEAVVHRVWHELLRSPRVFEHAVPNPMQITSYGTDLFAQFGGREGVCSTRETPGSKFREGKRYRGKAI